MSAGMEHAGSPVTARDGDFPSPNAPRGTGPSQVEFNGYGECRRTRSRWVSASMEPEGSPVTVRDGDFSSPDAPKGTVLTEV